MTGKTGKRAPRQKRSAERKLAIAEATVRVVASAGTHAVTHRAVAKAADVPLASTTYYFASKDDLLAEAFRHLVDRELDEIERGTAALPATLSSEFAAAITASFVADDLRKKRVELLAEMELYLEASRNRELRAILRRLDEAALAFCEELVRRSGSPEPEVDGGLLLSVIVGLQLGQLADPTPKFEGNVAGPLFRRLFDRLCG